MKDLEIKLENKLGQLALLGETLGANKISLEGGGVFCNGTTAIAHFLVEEPIRAKEALSAAGIPVSKINDVITVKLRQDVPGQLGLFCKRLAEGQVNIHVQYSDHSNQLVIVPDNLKKAKEISAAWMKEWWS